MSRPEDVGVSDHSDVELPNPQIDDRDRADDDFGGGDPDPGERLALSRPRTKRVVARHGSCAK